MLQLESRVESTTSSMERNQIGVLTIGTIPRRLPVSYRLRSCDLAFLRRRNSLHSPGPSAVQLFSTAFFRFLPQFLTALLSWSSFPLLQLKNGVTNRQCKLTVGGYLKGLNKPTSSSRDFQSLQLADIQCKVVRYTALLSGIAYGILYQSTLQLRYDDDKVRPVHGRRRQY